MRQRVSAARVARLSSVRPDGRPHVVPCCFALDGDVVYSAIDAKPKSTLALRRLENVRAVPAVALLVDYYDEDWSTLWWVRLDGTARVIDSGGQFRRALECLREKYAHYTREPPPGPVIAIDLTAWRAWP
jgi:PPOX class probable F420-dependent enzyme